MPPDAPGPAARLANLVELLTTLDQRVLAALDGIEAMRVQLARLDRLTDSGEDLVADLQKRVAHIDERLNRDLDELKEGLLAKLGELDLEGLGPRMDRLEQAVFSIERATVNLDETVGATVEALPGFATDRIKEELPDSAEPS